MKIKLSLCILCALILGVVGCNLFNPTESVNIDSGDAEALTYEGYIKFRANDYPEAEYYFSKAIEADSSHSEAWYGLAKTKLNLQEINSFELLKYVNTDGGRSSLPISKMAEGTSQKYQESIRYILDFLKIFISYDTTGRLDGVVTYNSISDSYMLLQMFQTMLILRKAMPSIPACMSVNAITGESECSLGDILNGLHGGKTTETLEALHEVFATCANNPESMGSVASQFLPAFGTMLSAEGKNVTISASCDAMSSVTQASADPNENEKALSTVISFSGYSQAVDEDGDGCVDEEVIDGQDNDGDGEIDEDPRDQSGEFVYDETTIFKNAISRKSGADNLIIIRSVGPNDKYRSVDIDMNGKRAEDAEWEFVFSDYHKRVENGNHKFKFAEKLTFNPQGHPFDVFMVEKQTIAKDYRGVYDLQYRKDVIGGCWVNYSDREFEEMLEAQRVRYEE
jgi:tetratricopeptide (TPR) repeat protein